jgi:mitogen-activated protein kinase kinase
MSTPLRKKRNFKALQLEVKPAPQEETEIMPLRTVPTAAPPACGKKRPPPIALQSSKPLSSTTPTDPEGNLLVLANGANSAPPTAGTASARRMTYHTALSNTIANLESNSETRFDLRNEDLKELQELGQGNGGSVKKVEHLPSKTIMAKKVSKNTTS